MSDWGGEGDDDVGGGEGDGVRGGEGDDVVFGGGEGGDVGGGEGDGVLVQAQPFTGQLAHGGQADQGVAELEPGIDFHNFFFLVVGKGEAYQLSEKRKSWDLRPSWLADDLQLAPRACVSESQSRGGL